MICQKCGAALEDSALFCPSCGARVQAETQQTTTTAANTGATTVPGAKSKSTALILEVVAGLFGFLGIGWIYAGETQKGILILIGNFVLQGLVLIFTLFFGVLCTIPISAGVSAYLLNEHIKKSPGRWV
jgi:TM2 domain-containing membrane protein YozV